MADDPHNTSDLSDPIEAGSVKEDSETKTARRELKQTSISEKDPNQKEPSPSQEDKSASEDEKAQDKAHEGRATPETTNRTSHYDLKEQVSSPKKKRAHEELDEPKDTEDGRTEGEAADTAANGGTILSRTDRSEPEKKRARDQVGRNAEGTGGSETNTSVPGSPRKSSAKLPMDAPESSETENGEASNESKSKSDGGEGSKVPVEKDKQQKSATAFASSGFAKLASSSQSPFGALGSSGKPGIFGAPSSGSQSPFGALASAQPSAAPKLSFGSAAGSPSPFGAVASTNSGSASELPKLSFASSTSPSPFGAGGLNGKPSSFGGGGVLGGGFASGSAFGAARLTSFASKSSEAHPSEKPARPFGAPESEDEGSEVGDEESESEDKADAASDKADDKDKEDSKQHADEKKKLKLQKVVVDDGESGEITLLAVRAKMFLMEKGTGWKERGAGMLKVNVPKTTIEISDHGYPDMSSFDASVLEDDENGGRSGVRLILRQDHTLRVILNTAIVPAMKFQLNQKLKAAYVLFTAFEGDEVNQVQMKMSEANATLFTQLMELIQKQLADV